MPKHETDTREQMDVDRDIIDWRALSALVSDFGSRQALELSESFFAEATESLTHLAEALDRRDWDTVERRAHSLKGAARNLGLAAFATAADTVVQACRAGTHTVATSAAHRLAPTLIEADRSLQSALRDAARGEAGPDTAPAPRFVRAAVLEILAAELGLKPARALCRAFLAEADGRLAVIRQSFGRADSLAIIERECWAMRGGAAEFGLDRMAGLLEEIALNCQARSAATLPALVARLERQLPTVGEEVMDVFRALAA